MSEEWLGLLKPPSSHHAREHHDSSPPLFTCQFRIGHRPVLNTASWVLRQLALCWPSLCPRQAVRRGREANRRRPLPNSGYLLSAVDGDPSLGHERRPTPWRLPLCRFVQRNFPAGTRGDQEPLRERKLPGGDHVNQVAGHTDKLQNTKGTGTRSDAEERTLKLWGSNRTRSRQVAWRTRFSPWSLSQIAPKLCVWGPSAATQWCQRTLRRSQSRQRTATPCERNGGTRCPGETLGVLSTIAPFWCSHLNAKHGRGSRWRLPNGSRRGLGQWDRNVVCHTWMAATRWLCPPALTNKLWSGSVLHSSNSVLLIQTANWPSPTHHQWRECATDSPNIDGSPRRGGWQTGNSSQDGPHGECSLPWTLRRTTTRPRAVKISHLRDPVRSSIFSANCPSQNWTYQSNKSFLQKRSELQNSKGPSALGWISRKHTFLQTHQSDVFSWNKWWATHGLLFGHRRTLGPSVQSFRWPWGKEPTLLGVVGVVVWCSSSLLMSS